MLRKKFVAKERNILHSQNPFCDLSLQSDNYFYLFIGNPTDTDDSPGIHDFTWPRANPCELLVLRSW